MAINLWLTSSLAESKLLHTVQEKGLSIVRVGGILGLG